MSSRSAPYLWVQLINAGALPLEALLLLLLLAGADPGPLPALERLLAWGLGAAAPALLLWSQPADPRSLLLLSFSTEAAGPADPATPDHPGEGPALQVGQIAVLAGTVLLLPLLVWLDRSAALAYPLSPLQGSDRLLCLLGASALMALMLWQWQQLIQAIWRLSGNPLPVGPTRNLGLPLLRLPALQWAEAEQSSGTPPTVEPEQPGEHGEGTDLDQKIG